MSRVRLVVEATLIGPILTHGSGAGQLGVDATVAMLPDKRCYLPFSLIKGRLRQSWDELGFEKSEEWFGSREGGWSATRGRFRFTDFVESRAPSRASVPWRHRIRIDEETGAADDGALQVIESPFAAGEKVVFTGEVSFFGSASDAEEIRKQLESAFRWTSGFGAGRTIGFGRFADVTISITAEVKETPSKVTGTNFDTAITLRDPFCLARRRIAENLFETDEIIPGSAIRGVAATTLNDLLGRKSSDVIDGQSVNDPQWSALAKHFNAISISHAFPSDGARPVEPPISIVKSRDGLFPDIALQAGPGLIGGQAPQFSIDWKGSAWRDLRSDYKWPDLSAQKEIRVRTAIDRNTRRAADKHLFSYEMIRPEKTVWRGSVSFAGVPDGDRVAVIEQFQRLFALEPAAWGKSKARGRLTLTGSKAENATVLGDTPWVVTLQTAALLCDPATLNETSGRDELFDAYAAAWDDLSGGSLRLVRFFAQQSLAGGYLIHRFRPNKRYAPFLLTSPGSVFVLEPASDQGAACIEKIARERLPLPQWAKDRYTEHWQGNPFLPVDGFGEVAVNLPCHRVPVADFELIEAWAQTARAQERVAAEENHADAKTISPRHEDTATGKPQKVKFSTRWTIKATLRTASDLHIGSGEMLGKRLTRIDRDKKTQEIEVGAVATDVQNRAYLPGSGLKGALRAWLLEQFPNEGTMVERVFGVGGDAETSRGGKVEVQDAHASEEQPGTFDAVPHWKVERLTGVTASAAIDRRTRTAQDEKLFHREYVPSGISFKVSLSGDQLDEAEVALLVRALQGFNDTNPIQLGAETREGWGRFTCSDVEVRSTGVEAWHEKKEWADRTSEVLNAASAMQRPARTDQLRIPIAIAFTGPFLVNEPSLTKKPGEENELPNHAERVGVDGKVVLPVSSFRGAIRSRAEKIVRTLGRRACAATDPENACKAIDSAENAKSLCITCQLFGAPGWATPIDYEGFRLTNNPDPYKQELVAIDRFAGGVSGTAKFNVKAVWRPEFASAMTVNLSRWTLGKVDDKAREAAGHARDAALGLLMLTLRDLADGDMTLGFGASKGYGACEATAVWPTDASTLVDAFHRHLGVTAGPPADAQPNTSPFPEPVAEIAPPRPAANDPDFYNPYHFVPAGSGTPGAIPINDLATTGHLTHAEWADQTFSGRILCRITTLTPLVIGKDQTPREGQPGLVAPLTNPDTLRPSIPSTSLRGLFSSIAEAASNSALRVLENRTLSYRSAMTQSLQAIGMIVDTPTGKKVRPLTLPAIRNNSIPVSYRSIFPALALKVYVNGYRRAGTTVEHRPGTFLDRVRPLSYSADRRTEFWYLKLSAAPYNSTTGGITCTSPHMRGDYLLGIGVNDDPIDEATYKANPATYSGYTRGILRVLGIDGRPDMPTGKLHEIFIPYPTGLTNPLLDAEEAVKEFERLAAERTDADAEVELPYSLKGSLRNSTDHKKIELRDGDLVCFEPDPTGTVVENLSISSIWRRSVDGTVHDFFRKISPDLLPLNPARTKVTIAEQMFGYVEESGTAKARAFAGKVRFSAADTSNGDAFMEPVALKILSSPKPPSPSLYFRPDSRPGYVSKAHLRQANDRPHGRKMYLHHAEAWSGEPWRTANAAVLWKQKNEVTPVKPGTEFLFHVDFENLTPLQLGLLAYAIRPNDAFRHKLGMGKSLGLGSVRVDPVALLLTDRKARYVDPWSEKGRRFHWCETLTEPAGWEAEYRVEAAAARERSAHSSSFVLLRKTFIDGMPKMERSAMVALETIGNPHLWPHPVHTPQKENASLEEKTYEWFVENDSKETVHQYLEPLSGSTPKPLHRQSRQRLGQDNYEPPPPPPKPIRLPEPRPKNEPVRQPSAPDREQWTDATTVYDSKAARIVATRPGGTSAWCEAEADDPRVIRIQEGAQPARISIRVLPDKSKRIMRIEFP